jgi:hypothetical protein
VSRAFQKKALPALDEMIARGVAGAGTGFAKVTLGNEPEPTLHGPLRRTTMRSKILSLTAALAVFAGVAALPSHAQAWNWGRFYGTGNYPSYGYWPSYYATPTVNYPTYRNYYMPTYNAYYPGYNRYYYPGYSTYAPGAYYPTYRNYYRQAPVYNSGGPYFPY